MDRIIIRNGIEYDRETGKEVYRNGEGRPYILEDDCGEPITYEDFALIVLAFYRRIVQDASGPKLFDQYTDEQTRNDSRKYLLEGLLEQNGYWVYEGYDTGGKRTYDSRFTRYMHTEDTHESTITMQDIADIARTEVIMIKQRVAEWAKAGWSREHKFYRRVMNATKSIS